MVQRLNLKWTMADVLRVEHLAKKGFSAHRVCEEIAKHGIEASPEEIVQLCDDMGRFIQTGRPRAVQ